MTLPYWPDWLDSPSLLGPWHPLKQLPEHLSNAGTAPVFCRDGRIYRSTFPPRSAMRQCLLLSYSQVLALHLKLKPCLIPPGGLSGPMHCVRKSAGPLLVLSWMTIDFYPSCPSGRGSPLALPTGPFPDRWHGLGCSLLVGDSERVLRIGWWRLVGGGS